MKSPVRRRVMTVLSAASALVAGLITVVAAPAAQAAITPDGWYTVTAVNSGKCVDARAAGTANGTVVQQYSCNQSASQEWQFQADRRRLLPGEHPQQRRRGLGRQQRLHRRWRPHPAVDLLERRQPAVAGRRRGRTGAYHFVSRNSGKCLDVPSASAADSVQLQQYACNGTTAQSFTLNPVIHDRSPASRTSARTW